MRKKRTGRVLIIQTYVPQYRKAVFDGLKKVLASRGIHLDLMYGDPIGAAELKSDAVKLPWAIYAKNRYLGVGHRKLVYQPALRLARCYDLVIVEQANKLLLNPILMVMNLFRMIRLGYWGHGKDFQGEDGPIARAVKRLLLPRVHWWFAYNNMSGAVVREVGFPIDRITCVMNTVDSEELEENLRTITAEDVDAQRHALGLQGRNVCIYIGGMYDKKRITFLVAACLRIREQIPDFEIIFLGGGIDKPIVDQFAKEYSWVISRGPTFGREKAVNLKLAKLLLMPGLVGLAIIDAFAARVPIVTTNVPYHSPEIDYLINGVNGEIVGSVDDVDEYASRIATLLKDDVTLSKLQRGCAESMNSYSVGAMVSRFSDGIVEALRL